MSRDIHNQFVIARNEAISYAELLKIASLKKHFDRLSASLAMTRSIVVFIAVFCLTNNLFSQTYPFVNHTVETGLSQAQVLCAFQDDEGVMWFGTNGGGITKFDGKNYEYINDKNGLPDNVVYCIKKNNSDGTILIGTNNGLTVYDPKLISYKEKAFKTYTTEDGLTHNRIFSICFLSTGGGHALLGTGNGVSNFSNNECKPVILKNNILNNAPVFNIMFDLELRLWYSTMGMGVFKQENNKIEQYSTANGLSHDMVFATFENKDNEYWFLTGEGITLLDLRTNKLAIKNNLPTQYTYYSVLKDKHSNIWLGTDNGVIEIKSNNCLANYNKSNGLIDNSIWNIYEDKQNNIWFTSQESGVSNLPSLSKFMIDKKMVY